MNKERGLKYGLVDKILSYLKKFRSWVERQRRYHFYGSSILIAYDAYDLQLNQDVKLRVRMIDFNHALPNTEATKDENYCTGLAKLMKVFENLATLHENPLLIESMFPAAVHPI